MPIISRFIESFREQKSRISVKTGIGNDQDLAGLPLASILCSQTLSMVVSLCPIVVNSANLEIGRDQNTSAME